VLLLLRFAVALAAYCRHDVVEASDLEQVARLLARHRLIDVKTLIA
jgi:AAA lid domain